MNETIAFSGEIFVVLSLLALTAYLFISERVRADVASLIVLALLGGMSITPGLQSVVAGEDLFFGFASDAVIAIIAIMIIGAGLDKTGVMARLAAWIVRIGRQDERSIMFLLASSSGLISAFVQNVGVIALFLPVVSRIAARTGLSPSRLLLPVGFCTILGGTITLVGCSPLILLNDTVQRANALLPLGQKMPPFDLFAVAPVGLSLLAIGIAYFLLCGPFVLPAVSAEFTALGRKTLDYFKRVYDIDPSVHELVIPHNCRLLGRSIRDVQITHGVRIIGTYYAGRIRLAPPVSVKLNAPAVLAVIADTDKVENFARNTGLRQRQRMLTFNESLLHTKAGIAEIVIPPNSRLIGQTIRSMRMRETYELTLLTIHRAGKSLIENLPEIPLQAGDTLVCHTTWKALARLEKNPDFVVLTSEYPHEEERPHKLTEALVFFALALGLTLFSDIRIGAAFLIGAVGMVVSKVLSVDEAYAAVSWKTVFLLAGLMPLGHVVQSSGTALWLAQHILHWLGGLPEWVLQATLALLASAFSLVMSNVGATILLIPIAVGIAVQSGADPALYALVVALGTSNSFVLPTNQVNALIIGPGAYRTADFVRVGSGMSLLFLVVSLAVLNLMFANGLQ